MTGVRVGFEPAGESLSDIAFVLTPIKDSGSILDAALLDNVGKKAFWSTRFWFGAASVRMAWWKRLSEDKHSHVIFRRSEENGQPLGFCVMIEHLDGVRLANVSTDIPRFHGLLSAGIPWVGLAMLRRRLKSCFAKDDTKVLRVSDWMTSRCLFIDQFAVHPESMGMGLGRKLLNDAVLLARKKKMSTIELRVDKANSRAISLYFKNDFQVIDESRTSYRLGLRISD